MCGIVKRHMCTFVTMSLLDRSVLLCAILLYCGVQSQFTDNRILAPSDALSSNEDASLIEDVTWSDEWTDDWFDDSSDSSSTSTDSLRSRKIIGGVDDERKDIRSVCPITADSIFQQRLDLSTPLECARTCNDRERPRTCYYKFFVEYYTVLTKACEFCSVNATNTFCNNCACVPADGVEKPILTVNRMIPGPTIDVCEGDKIVVDVTNAMEGDELTIHWHGVFQKGSQQYDGAAYVTQCPIPEGTTFRYEFGADNAGTHFWHAHTGMQKLDGVFGRLTIRQSRRRDENSDMYEYDLSRHGFIINDWIHELAMSRMPGRLNVAKFQYPDSILINGKGQYQDPRTGVITNTELEVFEVHRKRRYRFRMVNGFCTVCSSILTVQNHKLTVIAVDGVSIKPVVVDSIISVSGERYDFVINTDQKKGSYWIQLRAIASCEGRNIQQLAILRYEGAKDVPEGPKPIFTSPLPEGIILNPLDQQCEKSRKNVVCLNELESAKPVDGDIFRSPDIKLYLPFKFYAYENLSDLFVPNTFRKFLVAPAFRHTISLVEGLSLSLPPSPLLTQFEDIPPNVICNSTHKPRDCEEPCTCTHVIELPYNSIVELIIIDTTEIPGIHHPFHLHGYAFNVMGTGVINNGTGVTVDEIKRLDRRGRLPRRRSSPPFKDSIPVPNNGYAIIRFRANNPGYWFFHCHFVYHLATGMANIFHVQGPPGSISIPSDFPKCGDYLLPIRDVK